LVEERDLLLGRKPFAAEQSAELQFGHEANVQDLEIDLGHCLDLLECT
jgi:hypothetical protein